MIDVELKVQIVTHRADLGGRKPKEKVRSVINNTLQASFGQEPSTLKLNNHLAALGAMRIV